jgi:hypothetical protein
MKVQATVHLTFQAKTLADAGALLDEVLRPAHERGDVAVEHVELSTPPADRMVTLPSVATPSGHAPPGVPRNGT